MNEEKNEPMSKHIEEKINDIKKLRHYAIEEYDRESKLMSVGWNNCLDRVCELLVCDCVNNCQSDCHCYCHNPPQ